MIWKPGDRAVFCYRPNSPHKITPRTLSFIGETCTITGPSHLCHCGCNLSRHHVTWDKGGSNNPISICLAPIIEDPYAAIPKGEPVYV